MTELSEDVEAELELLRAMYAEPDELSVDGASVAVVQPVDVRQLRTSTRHQLLTMSIHAEMQNAQLAREYAGVAPGYAQRFGSLPSVS